jgi:nucleotide-binding universal stress UspA family protein
MYKKVLVPLDGSDLAECVLPEIRKLTEGKVVGEFILLNVVDIPSAVLADGFDSVSLKKSLMNKAKKYLSELESDLSAEGLNVKTDVIIGETAHSIIQYATENNADLIIIATHGYTGIKRVMFGSVALRVLHDTHVPVLLIRPESSPKQAISKQAI